jgi:RNA recognition motif-containing protein
MPSGVTPAILLPPVQLTEFFSQHGAVNCVRLRRHLNKMFKGSAFVEFQSVEVAEKVGTY